MRYFLIDDDGKWTETTEESYPKEVMGEWENNAPVGWDLTSHDDISWWIFRNSDSSMWLLNLGTEGDVFGLTKSPGVAIDFEFKCSMISLSWKLDNAESTAWHIAEIQERLPLARERVRRGHEAQRVQRRAEKEKNDGNS